MIYCPTGEMLADFYTKPLQGNLYRIFRDVIMGLKHISTLKEITQATYQERVVNSVTSDKNLPKNNKENESVAQVIS